MSELERLPEVHVPGGLKERTLHRALKPARRTVPRAVMDGLLVAFCVVHLGWCLRIVLG